MHGPYQVTGPLGSGGRERSTEPDGRYVATTLFYVPMHVFILDWQIHVVLNWEKELERLVSSER